MSYKNVRSLSHQEVIRGNGQFASEMTVDAGSGMRLYETARGGQDVARVNKFVVDEGSEARFTAGDRLIANDKTQVTPGQEIYLQSAAGIEKGANWIPQALRANAMLQGPRAPQQDPGGSLTNEELEEMNKYYTRANQIQNQKAAYRAGNYNAAPAAPAKPSVNLKPDTVEMRFPD